jgi:hypothetical protein
VSVPRPCYSPSALIVSGHGFGGTQPSGVGLVVGAWDESLAEVVCQFASIFSWSDTRISVSLPWGKVSGTIAFANLDWITRYNQWVDRENQRVQQIVENSECAGSKLPAGVQFRAHWAELPTPVAAASYKAGYAHISVEVSHVLGRFDGWWRGSILLQPGELFQIRWHSVNATQVSITAAGPSSAVLATSLAAAGYSSSGSLPLQGGLFLNAPADFQQGSLKFVLSADNDCDNPSQVEIQVFGLTPPSDALKIAVFQSLPGANYGIASTPSGEQLVGPSGEYPPLLPEAIPLVEGKRSVVRIQWWPGFPDYLLSEEISSWALLEVSIPKWGGPYHSERFFIRVQARQGLGIRCMRKSRELRWDPQPRVPALRGSEAFQSLLT